MKLVEPHITVRELTLAYGDFVIQRNLDFVIRRGDVFLIMGGSGCGKSTLLRHLIGLQQPAQGTIRYGDLDFWRLERGARAGHGTRGDSLPGRRALELHDPG